MQSVEATDRELLDAQALVGHLVAEGSMFEFLAGHRQDLFPDVVFEDLFPSGKGRPSIPASVMASILVLQSLHDLSDRETAEAARCDLRWKVATGMALDDAGFDASTLVYWRRRLATSQRPHRINDAVKNVIEQTGVLRGRRKRAVDSTILADAVATQDTVTQLISAIRRVRRQVPGAAEQIATVCTGHDYSQPGKPSIDWEDPDAKDALVSALVNDAHALVAALADAELDGDAEFAVALLALLAGQDVEPAEGSDGTDGRWRIARRVAPDRVVSTVDPDARHTRKSPEDRRDGYRAHVAAEPAKRRADLLHDRRRRDRETQVFSHERHHLTAHLQGRHVAVQVDPVQTRDIQCHVPIEQIVHRRHRSHDRQPDRTRQRRPARNSVVRGAASLGGWCVFAAWRSSLLLIISGSMFV